MAVFKGDIGTEIVLDTQLDLSEAEEVAIKARKPNGAEVSWDAEVYEDTKVRYVTDEDDLNAAGTWVLQAWVKTSEWTARGESVTLDVLPPFGGAQP